MNLLPGYPDPDILWIAYDIMSWIMLIMISKCTTTSSANKAAQTYFTVLMLTSNTVSNHKSCFDAYAKCISELLATILDLDRRIS